MANKNRNTPPDESPALAELDQPWAESQPEPAAEPAVAEAAPPAEKKTPHAWGEELGLTERADSARPWIEPHADWRFAAADKLHGWSAHAQAWQGEGQQLLITREDFDKALVAAGDYPQVPAHGPACGKGFEARAEVKTNG